MMPVAMVVLPTPEWVPAITIRGPSCGIDQHVSRATSCADSSVTPTSKLTRIETASAVQSDRIAPPSTDLANHPLDKLVSVNQSANTSSSEQHLVLESWRGPWAADDVNANFKADVALYSLVDPLVTLRGLSVSTGLPVGVLAKYVLARFATAGSSGMLELGPTIIQRLWEPIVHAEAANDDGDRLKAYAQLRDMISWLRGPLFDADLARTSYATNAAGLEDD